MQVDPESAKNIDNLTVYFALSRSARTNVAHRMLTKLTPEVDFTNIFSESFYMHRSQKRKKY